MLIAFSGFKGAGKDSAAAVLIDEYGFKKIAFADALREALLLLDPIVWADPDEPGVYVRLSEVVFAFGWDYCKRTYSEVRRLMQYFGSEVSRQFFGTDVWVDTLARRYPDINDPESRYVITDCRFANEVDFVLQASGDVCWVDRPGVESDGHVSETTDPLDRASYVFNNDGSLDDLKEDVRFFMFLKGVGNAP